MYTVLVLISLVLLIAFLIFGRVERHWVGLGVALLLLISGTVSLLEAFNYIDWDVLGLILCVSIYTIYLEKSGFAHIVAHFIAKHAGHSPYTTLFSLSLIAGMVSMFMENVSVVLIFYPIVFSLCKAIGMEPTIPMILVALSSNIAGSATMIGDPPAILTAGAFGLSFTDFIMYKGIPSMFFFTIISMIIAIAIASYIATKNLKITYVDNLGKEPSPLNNKPIDKVFFTEAIVFLVIKVVLLSIRSIINLPLSFSAAIAVGGLTITRVLHRDRGSVEEAFKQGFEWKLLLFLASVFILSGAFEKHGVAKLFSEYIIYRLGRDIFKITSFIIWFCAISSAVIDNVPMTLTMIPVVKTASTILNHDPVILMWATLIGITLGGNLTYIGASANVTAVRILEKNNYDITFTKFIKISIVYNTISLVIAWILYTLLYIV